MLWFLLAFLAAFFKSLSDALNKKGVQDIDEYVLSWVLRAFTLPFLLPLLLFIEIPTLGPGFWTALAVSGTINVFTTILYMKAMKHSDLSLVVPLMTLTPIFLLITSPIIIGEFPDTSGLVGVVMLVIGAYMLKIDKRSEGYLEPLKALLSERGAQLILLATLLWSISGNFDKIGIQNSSPIFWVISLNLFLATTLLPIMLYKSSRIVERIRRYAKFLLPIGLFSALYLSFQMTAFSLTLVVYVTAIKRLNVVFGVIWGHYFFNEEGLKERLLAAAIMVLGVIFIAVL